MFGLNPASLRRVDFIGGTALLYGDAGDDFVIINDGGDDKVNTGYFQNGAVSGMGITGGVGFGSTTERLEIDLGAQNDTFYMRGTPSHLTTTLRMGGGYDTVYVGNTSNSLDDIQGRLYIHGELPFAQDTLYFYDQGDAGPNTYTISSVNTGTLIIPDPNNTSQTITIPINETTLSRTGAANITYLTIEAVVLNASAGSDTIYLHSTHQDIDPLQGKNATFTINGGGGADDIHLGVNRLLEIGRASCRERV